MSKFSETTLSSWTKLASTIEENKINNAVSMVKSAIKNDANFDNSSYEVFLQGSYGNNTNFRANSDIDVNILLTSKFFPEYPEGKDGPHYGFTNRSISYSEYKQLILTALINKLGADKVSVGNKSIKINSILIELKLTVRIEGFRNKPKFIPNLKNTFRKSLLFTRS